MRANERASLAAFCAVIAAVTFAASRAEFSSAARSVGDARETSRSSVALSGRSLSDLTSPAAAILRSLSDVEAVETLVAAERPTHRIVHIADWHFVPKDAFAADIRDQSHETIADEELEQLYAEHLDEVRRVQAQQRRLLRELIRRHGVEKVFCEGLTDGDLPIYQVIIEHISRCELGERDLTAGGTGVDETLLRIGAAGQLLAAGELAAVLPAEDEIAYEQANPLTDEGELRFEDQANDARQAAIVRRLLDGGSLAVVVLGGGHDLSDQVRQLGGGWCEYISVRLVSGPARQ